MPSYKSRSLTFLEIASINLLIQKIRIGPKKEEKKIQNFQTNPIVVIIKGSNLLEEVNHSEFFFLPHKDQLHKQRIIKKKNYVKK